ncbi:MAG: HAMP domain-containing histidine kinase [candidate division Zixibacteria bacterium]|nr:HAMP domain-containing histidine kinase [candidate division Zixibacteria bacterium]
MAPRGNKYLLSLSERFSTVFKGFLLFGVCAIGAVFVYYTTDIVSELQSNEAKVAQTYTKIWQLVASDSTSGPVTSVLFDEIILKSNFPIVVTDTAGQPLFWKELSGIPEKAADPKSLERVRKRVESMKARKGEIPIYVDSVAIYKLYYDDTPLVGKLRLIPIVEMGMVAGFILLALVGFQYIRRSEQRTIWVGMAKETAHQLGTPISSLLGWLNLLKTGEGSDSFSPPEIYEHIETDLARLETVANRFGKIGSLPKLEREDLNRLTGEVVDYFRKRLPHQGGGVQIDFLPGELPAVDLDRELYNWVVENLLKNSLEAVDSREGKIVVRTYTLSGDKRVIVEVADNGRGISRGDARRVFRPGFTTKRRGWGLGLSLARRIIKEYHKGNIYLAASEPGKGATFVIQLPAA